MPLTQQHAVTAQPPHVAVVNTSARIESSALLLLSVNRVSHVAACKSLYKRIIDFFCPQIDSFLAFFSAAAAAMASYRILEVNLISAKDLKDVNMISKLEVYAVATLSGDPHSKQKTPTDRENRRNPSWNFPIKFFIPASADLSRLTLDIYMRAEKVLGDRDVGEVHVPIKDLDSTPRGDGKSSTFVSYQVRRPSGRPQGSINFSYKFGDPVSAQNPSPQPSTSTVYQPSQFGNPISAQNPPPQPSTATVYPPPQPSTANVYPPPQSSKADEPVTAYPVGYTPQKGNPQFAYPPPAGYPTQGYAGYTGPNNYGGYGYPPPPQGVPQGYGYGSYVAPPPPPPRKNKFGMGLGAGLLGGALGGLLIGDMIGDVGSYDSGYDAGFDDGGGGGFDF